MTSFGVSQSETSDISSNFRAVVGGNEEYKEIAKAYLCRQLDEYTVTIKKLKRTKFSLGFVYKLNCIFI